MDWQLGLLGGIAAGAKSLSEQVAGNQEKDFKIRLLAAEDMMRERANDMQHQWNKEDYVQKRQDIVTDKNLERQQHNEDKQIELQRDDKKYNFELDQAKQKQAIDAKTKADDLAMRKYGYDTAYGKDEHAGIKESAKIANDENKQLFEMLNNDVAPNSPEAKQFRDRITNNQSIIDRAKTALSQTQKQSYDFGTANGLPADTLNVPSMDNQSKKTITQIKSSYGDIINKAAIQHGADPNMITAIITNESGGNPNATSSSGAKGLMQIVRGTGQDLGLVDPKAKRDDRTNPEANVLAGSKYFASMLNKYQDNELALAAYNDGPGTVDLALMKAKEQGLLPSFQSIRNDPELKQARNYVPKVMQTWRQLAMDKGDDTLNSPQTTSVKAANTPNFETLITDKDIAPKELRDLRSSIKKTVETQASNENVPKGLSSPAELNRESLFFRLMNDNGFDAPKAKQIVTSPMLMMDGEGVYHYDGKTFNHFDMAKGNILKKLQTSKI